MAAVITFKSYLIELKRHRATYSVADSVFKSYLIELKLLQLSISIAFIPV